MLGFPLPRLSLPGVQGRLLSRSKYAEGCHVCLPSPTRSILPYSIYLTAGSVPDAKTTWPQHHRHHHQIIATSCSGISLYHQSLTLPLVQHLALANPQHVTDLQDRLPFSLSLFLRLCFAARRPPPPLLFSLLSLAHNPPCSSLATFSTVQPKLPSRVSLLD